MIAAETLYHAVPVWLQNVLLNVHAFRIDRHRFGIQHLRLADALMPHDSWDPERRREFQEQRIRSVMTMAYQRTAYYREVMDRVGLAPGDIRRLDDMRHFPLLEKDTVRTRVAELLVDGHRAGWHHGHTSGTTGSPLPLWYDRRTCLMTNAVDRRHKRWAGIADDEWIGILLGRVVVSPAQRTAPFWRVNRVHRQVWFSAFHMSDEALSTYVQEMRRRCLRVLEGYPSTLHILADYLLRSGQRLPLKTVITSSETLHPIQRERIEAAFECRLFDFYALAERVAYAGECEAHEGKHIAEDYSYVEIVDEAGQPVRDGEQGYLVGTSLVNLAMPMIRYRTGDLTSILVEPCSCGRTHRRIADVATKAEDVVVTPDGRAISPSVLTHPFKPFSQIIKSQLVQERPDYVAVRIVQSGSFAAHDRESLVSALRERLGPGVAIDVVEVDEIPPEPSGKFRWVISRVPAHTRIDWSGGLR